MLKTNKFFRSNLHMMTMSLLLASLFSCKKENSIVDPLLENSTVSNESTLSAILPSANILFHENADGTGLFGSYVSLHTGTSYAVSASTSPLYNGTKSARFELRDSDPEVKNGTRAEVSFPYATHPNRWYSYAVYFPSDGFKYDNEDDVISQWHQGGGKTPALALRTRYDHLYLRTVENTWHDLGPIEKDKWHAYVMHVKHSSGSDGLIELWRDGKLIFNRTGPNMYDISDGTFHMPRWKLGLYKSDWNGSETTQTNQRVLYFDDIKLGNENANYDEMVPVPNKIISQEPDPATSTISDSRKVVSFTLVDANTEKDVLIIRDGQSISLRALKLGKVNIRANTEPAILGSVKFELSGKQSRQYTDNKAPYALHGDNGNGNYYYGNWNPPALGTYTLKATPYADDDAVGTMGISKTITFKIVK